MVNQSKNAAGGVSDLGFPPHTDQTRLMTDRPVVSVCMTTYQHRPFIHQALESVLTQETSFPFEFCIGEDGSNDGTREICLEYAKRCPDRIRLFLRNRADVIYIDGKPTGRYNFVETLRASRGRYIALLEGDDYWTSPHKLQEQFEVLESDQSVSLCAHDVQILDEAGQGTRAIPVFGSRGLVVSLDDLLDGMKLPTASLFLRRWESWEFPPWFYSLPMADWPLAVLCALRGKVVFLPKKMAAYRLHAGGYWSSQRIADQTRGAERFYQAMLEFLGSPYRKKVKELLFRTRAHREYLENHPWRSRCYRYVSAWYGGPRAIVREAMLTFSRIPRRFLGSGFRDST